MANELQLSAAASLSVYALIRDSHARIWDTVSLAFVTYVSGNYSRYPVTMTEQGAATGFYVGSFPATADGGQYTVDYKSRAGGSPAESDTTLSSVYFAWATTNTTTTPSGAAYCASGDVSARLSQFGLGLRTDDDPATVTDCIANAASDIDVRLLPIYSAAELLLSRWVHFASRALSVYYVCLRRNEPVPASVQAEYDKTMDELAALVAGQMTLPGAAKKNAQMRVSNTRYDLTRFPSQRIVRPQSTPASGLPTKRYDETSDAIVR